MIEIELSTQDLSRVSKVDFESLVSTDSAQPVNLAGYSFAFREKMVSPTGEKYQVTFGFSDDEVNHAGDDASRLPFDADHIARITLDE